MQFDNTKAEERCQEQTVVEGFARIRVAVVTCWLSMPGRKGHSRAIDPQQAVTASSFILFLPFRLQQFAPFCRGEAPLWASARAAHERRGVQSHARAGNH